MKGHTAGRNRLEDQEGDGKMQRTPMLRERVLKYRNWRRIERSEGSAEEGETQLG